MSPTPIDTAPADTARAMHAAEMRGPQRIQLSRAKGWRMPPNTVKVDRSTRWGNMAAKIGDDISYYTAGCTSATAADVVELFSRLLDAHRSTAPKNFDDWIAPLRGKNLACWCKPGTPCHADVLLEVANK